MTASTGWPGLGFDPAPGDPAGAAGLGRQLTDTARYLRETHAVLTSVQEQRGTWTGEASKAFVQKLEGLPRYLDDAQVSLGRASGVMQEWNGKLGGLQTRARDLESRAVTARTQLMGAEEDELRARANPDLGLAGQLFAQQDLPEVGRRLDAARAGVEQAMATAGRLRDSLEDLLRQGKALSVEHEDEAHRTAEGIRRADDGLAPPEPAWYEQALNWLGENLDTIGDVAGFVSSVASALALIPVLTPFAAPIALITGGVALLAHGADLVVNEKWDEPGAYLNIGADLVGLIPGAKILGAAGDAAWSTFNSVPGLTASLSAGWTAARAALPDALTEVAKVDAVAQIVGDRVAPLLGSAFPAISAIDPIAVAKTFQGATDVVPQIPTVNEWVSGDQDTAAKNVASGATIGYWGANSAVERLAAAAAAAT